MIDSIRIILDEKIDTQKVAILNFHDKHLKRMLKAKGSQSKHQAWEGGYYDHINQCLILANIMHQTLNESKTFKTHINLSSVIIVLYFHDIEKLFKYTSGLPKGFNKWKYLTQSLKKQNITFTDEELNALEYIHGEGEDYNSETRIMNELAGFCHAIDVLSARVYHGVH